MKNYSIITELGTGSFGKVQLANHLGTGDQVAIKTIAKSKLKKKQDLQMVNKEIAVFKSVNHRNIIRLYEIIEDQSFLYLIMEHADQGDLLTFIKNAGPISQFQTLKIMKQLLCALQYLHHEKSIAHRDIKLANILLTSSDNKIKLADFGLSNFYDKNVKKLRTSCGSPCYSAPQVLIGGRYCPISADIWSLGVVFYSLIEGCLPFYDENIKQLYKQVIKGRYYQFEKASKQIKVLIKMILQINPETRITLAKFIEQIDKLLEAHSKRSSPSFDFHQQQSDIEELKKTFIISILSFKHFPESQVMEAYEYKKQHQRPKKFNSLNTHIELLMKKTLEKLQAQLNQLRGETPLKIKNQQYPILKRNNSTYTKDSNKSTIHNQKALSKARFIRNGNNNRAAYKQGQNQCLQELNQFDHNAISNCIQYRQNSRLRECSREEKQHQSKLNIVPRKIINSTYIKLNEKISTSISINQIQQSIKLNLQSLSSSCQKNTEKKHARKVSSNVNLLTCYDRNCEKYLNLNIKTERHKLSITENIQSEKRNRQEQLEVYKGSFNIMHTFKCNSLLTNVDRLIKQAFQNVRKQGNFKYTINLNGSQQIKIQIMQAENITSLKVIKVEPFNSVILYQIKQILRQNENQANQKLAI